MGAIRLQPRLADRRTRSSVVELFSGATPEAVGKRFGDSARCDSRQSLGLRGGFEFQRSSATTWPAPGRSFTNDGAGTTTRHGLMGFTFSDRGRLVNANVATSVYDGLRVPEARVQQRCLTIAKRD